MKSKDNPVHHRHAKSYSVSVTARRGGYIVVSAFIAVALFVSTVFYADADPSETNLVDNTYTHIRTTRDFGTAERQQYAYQISTSATQLDFTITKVKFVLKEANTGNTGTEGIQVSLHPSKTAGCASIFSTDGNRCPDMTETIATATLPATAFDAADEAGEKTVTFNNTIVSGTTDGGSKAYYWVVLKYEPSAGKAKIDMTRNDGRRSNYGWSNTGTSFYGTATELTTESLLDESDSNSSDLAVVMAVQGYPENSTAENLTITGTPRVDFTLTADTSTITDGNGVGSSPGFTYQWHRQEDLTGTGREDITGATGQTYQPAADDIGKYITVTVNFTDRHTYAETVTSNALGPITDPAFGITIEDDPDGDTPEQEKEIIITTSHVSGFTETKWAYVDSAAACTSSTTFTGTYTPSIEGYTLTINTESANGKHVCFTAKKNVDGTDRTLYEASGEIGGIDTTKPELSSPSSIGETRDSTPDFSFTSDEAGAIQYIGDCNSVDRGASVGVNTITFSVLPFGSYNSCKLTVTDEAGNVSDRLAVPSFVVNFLVPPVIVSNNLGQTGTDGMVALSTDLQQGFTVGHDVESIVGVKFHVTTPAADSSTNTLTVTAHWDNGSGSTATGSVTVDHDVLETVGLVTAHFDQVMQIDPGADGTLTVTFDYDDNDSANVPNLKTIQEDDEDIGGARLWGIDNQYRESTDEGATWNDAANNHSLMLSLLGAGTVPLITLEEDHGTAAFPQKRVIPKVVSGASDLRRRFFDPRYQSCDGNGWTEEDTVSAYTPGMPVIFTDTADNGTNAVCFRATYEGDTVYVGSGAVSGITPAVPRITPGTLASLAYNGINSTKNTAEAATELISITQVGNIRNTAITYKLAPLQERCEPPLGTALYIGSDEDSDATFLNRRLFTVPDAFYTNGNEYAGDIERDTFTLRGTPYDLVLALYDSFDSSDIFKIRQRDGTEVDSTAVLTGYFLSAAYGDETRSVPVSEFDADETTVVDGGAKKRNETDSLLGSWEDRTLFFSIDKTPYTTDRPTVSDIPADGYYKVCSRAVSPAGTVSYTTTPMFTRDTVAPEITIDAVTGDDLLTRDEVDIGTVDITGTGSFDLSRVTMTVGNTDGTTLEPHATLTTTASSVSALLPDTPGMRFVDAAEFGAAIVQDGDRLIVGAPRDSTNGNNYGAVYILEDKNGDGDYGTGETADDGEVILLSGGTAGTAGIDLKDYNNFGSAVALDGDRLFVGAIGLDSYKGAVYILEDKDGDGGYDGAGESIILSDDTPGISLESAGYFGSSVAVDSSRIVVGAWGADSQRGAVYILEDKNDDGRYDGDGEFVKLSNSTAGITLAANDKFGSAVALQGDSIIVGATENGNSGRGSVYILEDKNGDGDYSDTRENIVVDNSTPGITLGTNENFGAGVAVDGPRIFVGATGADGKKGAVYILEDKDRSGGNYVARGEVVRIDADMAVADSGSNTACLQLGGGIAVDDDRLIIGTSEMTNGCAQRSAIFDITLQKTFTAPISVGFLRTLTPGPNTVTVVGNDTVQNTRTETRAFSANHNISDAYTIKLKDTSDLGISNSDNLTSDTTPTLVISGFETADTVTVTASRTGESDVTAQRTGNGEVTLAALADGEWSISATDGTNTTGTLVITVESVKPALSSPGTIGTTSSVTPLITFTSDEAGTARVGGGCASEETPMVVGTNTIQLNTLSFATYANCTITGTDNAGNVSDALAIPSFTVVFRLRTTVDPMTGDNRVDAVEDDSTVQVTGRVDPRATAVSVSYIVNSSTITVPGTLSAPASDVEQLNEETLGLTTIQNGIFGDAVVWDGSRLLVGVTDRSDGHGGVLIFDDENGDGSYTTGEWTTINFRDNVRAVKGDGFGSAIAVDGDRLIVGAPKTDGAKGNVHILEDKNGNGSYQFSEQMRIGGAEVTLAVYDQFGAALAVDGDRLIIGAPGDSSGPESEQGAFYIFEDKNNDGDYRDSGETAKFLGSSFDADMAASAAFGSALAVDGDYLFVGAPEDSSGSGAIFILKDGNNDGDYADTADGTDSVRKIDTSASGIDGTGYSRFGSAIAVHDGMLFVGADYDGESGSSTGAVFILEDKNGDGDYADGVADGGIKITDGVYGFSLSDGDKFGQALATDGTRLFIAAGDTVINSAEKGTIYSVGLPVHHKPFSADLTSAALGAMDPGEVTLTITATAPSGSSEITHTFIHDTSGIDLKTTSDSGSDDADDLTNDSTPDITVSGFKAGDTVTVTAVHRFGDEVSGSITGNGDVTLGTLADGVWQITATTDIMTSPTLEVTIDTQAPSNTTMNPVTGDNILDYNELVHSRGSGFNLSGTVPYDTETLSVTVADSGTVSTKKTPHINEIGAEPVKITDGYHGISTGTNDRFGSAIAADGRRMVIGVSTADNGKGAVYILDDTNGNGYYEDRDTAAVRIGNHTPGITLENRGLFGSAVAVDGDRLIVGAPHASGYYGIIYILEDKNGDGSYDGAGENIQIDKNTPGMSLQQYELFGSAVAVDGDRLLVGSYGADSYKGAVYILEDKNNDGRYDDTGENMRIDNSTSGLTIENYANFGTSIAVDGDRLLVGASSADSRKGRVYILEDKNDDGDYADTDENIQIGDGTPGISLVANIYFSPYFSRGLAVDNGRIFIGADAADDNRGVIYILEDKNDDGDYADEDESIRIGDNSAGLSLEKDSSAFGRSILFHNDRLYVGAPTDNTGGTFSGAVYRFDTYPPLSKKFGTFITRYNLDGLSAGTMTVTYKTTDKAGNTDTDTHTFTYSAKRGLELDDSSDTGVSDSDGITSDNTPTIILTGFDTSTKNEQGDLTDSVTITVTATHDTAGDVTATVAPADNTVNQHNIELAALADGVWSITATDGTNTGGPLSITVDTATPTITVGAQQADNTITAAVNEDNVAGRYTVIADTVCNETVLSETGGTAYSFSDPIILPDTAVGKYLCFRAEDAAGNSAHAVSAQIAARTFFVGLHRLSDTGVSDSDGITSDSTPDITVTGFPVGAGITVTAVKAGETDVTAQRNGNGVVTLGTLSDGEWSISATDGTDTAGTLTVTIDTAAPVVTPGTPTTTALTATVSETGVTGKYVITQSDTCNRAVFTDNGGGTAYTYGNTITLTAANNNGYACFSAEDTAGNVGYAVSVKLISVPRTLALKDTSDTGFSDADGITSDNTPTLVIGGSTSPAVITVRAVHDGSSHDVTAQRHNNGEVDLPTLADGEWSITASDGSTVSDPLVITVDTELPVITPGDQQGTTITASVSEGVTAGKFKRVNNISNAVPGLCNAAAFSGNTGTAYTFDDPITLTQSDAGKTVCFSAVDLAGNEGYAGVRVRALELVHDTGTDNSDRITNNNPLVLSTHGIKSSTPAGVLVTAVRTAPGYGSGVVTQEGEADSEVTIDLPADGEWRVSISNADGTGSSLPLTVTVDTKKPVVDFVFTPGFRSSSLTVWADETVTGRYVVPRTEVDFRCAASDFSNNAGTAHTFARNHTISAQNNTYYCFMATDTAGNTTYTPVGQQEIDLRASSDTGFRNADNITSDVNPLVGISGFPSGTMVTIVARKSGSDDLVSYIHTQLSGLAGREVRLGYRTSAAEEPEGSLTDGVWEVTASSRGVEATMTITVDTTAPTMTVRNGSVTCSGYLGSGGNRAFTDCELVVDAEDETEVADIRYIRTSDNACNETILPANGGTGYTSGSVITITDPNTPEQYCFRATDAAGNHLYGDPIRTPITIPSSRSVSLALQSGEDTGVSDSDGITNDATPTMLVNGFTGSFTVTARRMDDWLNTTVSVTGDQNGAVNFTTALSEGTPEEPHVWHIIAHQGRSRDDAIFSNEIRLTVDTVKPVISLSPAAFFENTGIVIASVEETRPDPGTYHYTLVETEEACTAAAFTGSEGNYTDGEPVQMGLRGSDNGKYICFRAGDTAGNIGYAVSRQIAGVASIPLSITVTDDADGSTPEKEKRITVHLSTDIDVTDTVWGIIDRTAVCGAASDASLIHTYTPSTTGTGVRVRSESDNGKVACFKASRDGTDFYAASGVIAGIDRTPPAAPGTPDLAAADDTGTLNDDNITNAGTITISVATPVNGGTVRVYVDPANPAHTTVLKTGEVVSGTAAVTFSTLLDGAHSVTATVTDEAGNESPRSAPLSLTIDTASPAIAFASQLAITVNTGRVTPLVTEENTIESMQYGISATNDDAACSAAATTGFTSDTEIVLTLTTDNNDQFLCFKAVDVAGNVKILSVMITGVADRAIDLVTASDSGHDDADDITNDNTPTFTVAGFAADAVVTVTATHSSATNVTETRTGDGEITLGVLTDGVWSVVAEDSTHSSPELEVTIDTVHEGHTVSAFKINNTAPGSGADVYIGPGFEVSMTVTFGEWVTTEHTSNVQIRIPNTATRSTRRSLAYDLSATITDRVAEGQLQYSVESTTDVAGNTDSGGSYDLTGVANSVTVDTTAPVLGP